MTRFAAIMEYDGANYNGWQYQPGLPTIQAEVESALETISKTQTTVYAAGRTDSGVHAKGQTIHFDMEWNHGLENLIKALNSLLPADIAVKRTFKVTQDFHARHSAIKKTYKYYVFNSPLKAPFIRRYSLRYPYPIDINKINQAAKLIESAHDFQTFGQPTDGTTSTVREIFNAHWEQIGPDGMICFTVTGSGFLRHMVRSLVGSLIEVGAGKVSVEQFKEALEGCDRSKAGPTAAPQGLFLERVFYDPDKFPELQY